MISAVLEDELLRKVAKPTRYTGGELNQCKKDWLRVDVTMAFAFPDVYEVAMSHLGMRILYHLVNEQPDLLMERVFAPWMDMEDMLRKREIPLFSLESHRPMAEFDVVGFTLQHEMSFTNVLNMLDLGKIALRSSDRKPDAPLIIAGGPCAANPEPLADFLDLVVLGDGEEVLPLLLRKIAAYKKETGWRNGGEGAGREELLHRLARIPGVYVPAFYQPHYGAAGELKGITPRYGDLPLRVRKQVVGDLEQAYFPTKPLVPFMEVVHDRVMLEVLRGCSRACRFCQAGTIYRPVRERSMATLKKQAVTTIQNTGYDEISLTSLNTADYSGVEPLIQELTTEHAAQKVGISLPSLRVDAFSVDLAKAVQKVRKRGLTFAPEAGTQRLRDVINKGVTEEDLWNVVDSVFSNGWSALKLYFIIGLPTETTADLDGIVSLAEQVVYRGTSLLRKIGVKKPVRVTVSVSAFIPKPQTPFQWEPQVSLTELENKQAYLRSRIRDRRITLNWHDAKVSFLEAELARGDRRLGQVIFLAWQKGCKFDGWSEHFNYERWLAALVEAGLEPGQYAYRVYPYDAILPWEHLDFGINRRYLVAEHQRALAGVRTADCRRDKCQGCGVCSSLEVSVDLRGDHNGKNPHRLL
ncbi:MAG: TIGR03960 family B12-binding radical SAM protein [Heliobacteriaceae bacterium]|nr:TIGR03960 family B12-binding radical SAM protein [Heliobacteriaceae bacterium]